MHEVANIIDSFRLYPIQMIRSYISLTVLPLELIMPFINLTVFIFYFYAHLSDWLIMKTRAKQMAPLGNA